MFGSAFKLLMKASQEDQIKYNSDGMLMIISMMIDKLNAGAIKNNGILKELQKTVYGLIRNAQGD